MDTEANAPRRARICRHSALLGRGADSRADRQQRRSSSAGADGSGRSRCALCRGGPRARTVLFRDSRLSASVVVVSLGLCVGFQHRTRGRVPIRGRAQFARQFRSTYDGTHIALDIPAASNALLRQTISALPGFELIATRSQPGTASGSFWRPSSQMIELVRELPGWGWILILLQIAATAVLARVALRGAGTSARTLVVVAICIVLPNIPISLTPRYQLFAHHRMYPHWHNQGSAAR